MIKLNNVLLVSALLLTLTACDGGGSSAGISEEAKSDSLEKITNYASDSASNSSVKPVEQDYINAGVKTADLDYVDIDELNSLVASKNASQVDSEKELQDLAHSIVDKTPPVITLNGEVITNITLNSNYVDANATAVDAKDGEVATKLISNGVDTTKEGTYKVIYTAVDKVGNKATKIRTVNVIADNVPPVITINTPLTIKEGEELSPSATTDDGSIVNYGGETITSSTLPGKYTIEYHAVDSFGNTSDIAQEIEVKALTISELLTASLNGREGVTYIAVGDSTRNYPGTNISFVNEYYPSLLNNINVKFKNSAASGQKAYEWLAENSWNDWLSYTETIDMIPTDYVSQRNYILEFSMGINDAADKRPSEFTTILRDSIKKLQSDRKYMKILLVSPVPHKDRVNTHADQLEEIYKSISEDLHLPLVSGRDILLYKYNNERTTYYADDTHPNEAGSKILFNHIFESIATPTIYDKVRL